MPAVTVLGATGSVGKATLDVLSKKKHSIFALAAKRNVEALSALAREHEPRFLVLKDEEAAQRLRDSLPRLSASILSGMEGLLRVCTHKDVDIIVSAIPGADGLLPTLEAARRAKTIALATKEIVVMAGPLLLDTAKRAGARILPIDSEHNAIFQAMKGHRREDIKRVIITASGGPFWSMNKELLAEVTPEEALLHPHWQMGRKITVDSATLMNKGLEVIEAHHLFGIPLEKIEVLIHPECMIHSLVEFVDGCMLACFFPADMRIPISYALNYPRRRRMKKYLNLANLSLSFHMVDKERFPLLPLAYKVAKEGGTLPSVLVGADERAVQMFLEGKIPFTQIPKAVEKCVSLHSVCSEPSLDDIINAYEWAQQMVERFV